jgi:hypothetical protein
MRPAATAARISYATLKAPPASATAIVIRPVALVAQRSTIEPQDVTIVARKPTIKTAKVESVRNGCRKNKKLLAMSAWGHKRKSSVGHGMSEVG